jgi:hypothetical protein
LVDELAARDLGLSTAVRQIAETMPDDVYLLSIQLRRAGPGEQPPGYQGPDLAAVVSLTGIAPDLAQIGSWLPEIEEQSALDAAWIANTTVAEYSESSASDGIVFTIEAAMAGPAIPARTLADDDLGGPAR